MTACSNQWQPRRQQILHIQKLQPSHQLREEWATMNCTRQRVQIQETLTSQSNDPTSDTTRHDAIQMVTLSSHLADTILDIRRLNELQKCWLFPRHILCMQTWHPLWQSSCHMSGLVFSGLSSLLVRSVPVYYHLPLHWIPYLQWTSLGLHQVHSLTQTINMPWITFNSTLIETVSRHMCIWATEWTGLDNRAMSTSHNISLWVYSCSVWATSDIATYNLQAGFFDPDRKLFFQYPATQYLTAYLTITNTSRETKLRLEWACYSILPTALYLCWAMRSPCVGGAEFRLFSTETCVALWVYSNHRDETMTCTTLFSFTQIVHSMVSTVLQSTSACCFCKYK